MKEYTELKNEIQKLIDHGDKLYYSLERIDKSKCKDFGFFILNYEEWYTKALVLIKQLIPDRTQDFILLYSNPKRKEINFGTYSISDALRGIHHTRDLYGPWTAALNVLRQVKMLQACLDKFDSKIYSIQVVLQADIFDSEIETAKHLLKMGFLRAAGAICGVVLEKHFSGVCHTREIVTKKKNPTITDFNDALKDNVYDTVEWRRVQRLGDIRNLCDHSKEREPNKDEVEELISGTEQVIKTIF